MARKQREVQPEPDDTLLLVIDLDAAIVHGVRTNVENLEAVKVLVHADRKDGEADRAVVVTEETHEIVYQTDRIAFDECAQLLTPLAQYDSKQEDRA
jgi:hypothetical protein